MDLEVTCSYSLIRAIWAPLVLNLEVNALPMSFHVASVVTCIITESAGKFPLLGVYCPHVAVKASLVGENFATHFTLLPSLSTVNGLSVPFKVANAVISVFANVAD